MGIITGCGGGNGFNAVVAVTDRSAFGLTPSAARNLQARAYSYAIKHSIPLVAVGNPLNQCGINTFNAPQCEDAAALLQRRALRKILLFCYYHRADDIISTLSKRGISAEFAKPE